MAVDSFRRVQLATNWAVRPQCRQRRHGSRVQSWPSAWRTRLADPETYMCGHNDVMGFKRDVTTCICAICSGVRVFNTHYDSSPDLLGVTEKEKEKEKDSNLGHAEKETPAKELTFTASRPQIRRAPRRPRLQATRAAPSRQATTQTRQRSLVVARPARCTARIPICSLWWAG